MISLRTVKKFCKDYTKIENYEQAVNDNTQTWICHHILGEILTPEQLIEHNFYYDVPPCMLKFVTKAEHNSIHQRGDKNGFYGKKHSIESRVRMSTSHKSIPHTEEHIRKISEAMKGNTNMKGKHLSDETRRKMSEAAKRRTHYKIKYNEHNI